MAKYTWYFLISCMCLLTLPASLAASADEAKENISNLNRKLKGKNAAQIKAILGMPTIDKSSAYMIYKLNDSTYARVIMQKGVCTEVTNQKWTKCAVKGYKPYSKLSQASQQVTKGPFHAGELKLPTKHDELSVPTRVKAETAD